MAWSQEERALLARLETAVGTMEEVTREVFLMHRLESLDYFEIGERLGLPVGEVERRIAAAMGHLDRVMGEAEGRASAG
jgi:RNA polymerase sigma-70 factor (ECF subfamily)